MAIQGPVDFETTTAEREVADLLPIKAGAEDCRRVLAEVPFWFHTFCLNRELGIYTPGSARDHRYRVPALHGSLDGRSVLDVGTFDGFYAFLAEHRGAGRVLAVDNEQYREWVRGRWGLELRGGEGFEAIRELLESRAEYRRLDAFDLDRLSERFDLIYCFGILHRVEEPERLLELLRERVERGGEVLVETYGAAGDHDGAGGVMRHDPGDVYEGDDYIYWGFSSAGLSRLAAETGFESCEIAATPVIDGHPRILARLRA